jgi:integrase
MPYKDLPHRLEQLRAYRPGGYMSRMKQSPLALLVEFMILAGGIRPGEARLAQWKEFDFETMVWNVPPEHLKMGRKHGRVKQIPISKQMLSVLEQAKLIVYPKDNSKISRYVTRDPIFQRARHQPDNSPDALVFPNSNNQEFIPEMIARFIRGTMKWPKVTPHGFRSTLRDWMRGETGFKDVLWKIQADHSLGNGDKSDESYGHDKLLDQRRILLTEWGKYCSQPRPESQAGKVLKLNRRET